MQVNTLRNHGADSEDLTPLGPNYIDSNCLCQALASAFYRMFSLEFVAYRPDSPKKRPAVSEISCHWKEAGFHGEIVVEFYRRNFLPQKEPAPANRELRLADAEKSFAAGGVRTSPS